LAAGSAADLHRLAAAWFSLRDPVRAERWYRAALLLDPGFAPSMEHLAAICQGSNRADEAAALLAKAYALQWVFVEPAAESRATVVLIFHNGRGHVPVTFLLPPERFTRVRCMLEYAREDGFEPLPTDAVVFNIMGDPDWVEPHDAALRALLARIDRPVLNRPEVVLPTRRDRLADHLSGIDVLVPLVRRIDGGAAGLQQVQALIDAGELTFPLLLRPVGTHGGKGVVLANSMAEVAAAPWASTANFYATQYFDGQGADGMYRKYRVVFVDRVAYPYHLAISPNWLVHYFSADMLAHAWKLDEERAFLAEPAVAVGAAAWHAIGEIGERLDLDYGGIDFTMLPDGRLCLFEANATMQVHPEAQDGPLAHKNAAIDRITDAFAAMIERAASARR
jgi:hypothetical protein